MRIKSNKIIKFIQTAYKVARRSIATYSNKFSKHKYTQPQQTHAKCMIPIKKNREKTGKYRLSMLTDFNEDEYHRRSLAETVISVEKRVLDDVNYGRKDRMRNKESKLRNICYNIYKYAMIFILETRFYFTEIIEDFYKVVCRINQ